MGKSGNRIWNGWNINKFCSIDSDIDTNLYLIKLRISKINDTTILDIVDSNRVIIDRGIYSDGYLRVLCII